MRTILSSTRDIHSSHLGAIDTMKASFVRLAIAAAAGLFAATGAHAAPVISWNSTNGGVSELLNNNFLSGFALEGGNLTLQDVGPGATVGISYWGIEAGFVNKFLWAGTEVFSKSGVEPLSGVLSGPIGGVKERSVFSAGTLDFAFQINAAGSPGDPSTNFVVQNGTANNIANQPNIAFFFGSDPIAPSGPNGLATSGTSVFVLLDDGCGNVGPTSPFCDDNHDDLIIQLTVAPIPEPGTVALMVAGLLALGGVVVRRRDMRA
jgi:hypothetical protein